MLRLPAKLNFQRITLGLLSVVFMSATTPAMAHDISRNAFTGQSRVSGLGLDLTSNTASVRVSRNVLPRDRSAAIEVADVLKPVKVSDLLTPAEFLALGQVLHGGSQDLVLDPAGRAVGGSVKLNDLSSLRGSPAHLSQLVIPQAVTLLYDVGTGGAVHLSNNLTNAGTIYAFSSNPRVTTAQISASNIYNNAGAVISTVLPAGQPGPASAVPNLSLSISALNDIVNAGTLSSGGKLTLTAGGSIVNALPSGVTAMKPVMQANSDVNLAAANIVNSGQIASLFNNINITTQTVQDIAVNNTGGLLQALSGAISFREPNFAGNANISLIGGDFLSKTLKLYSGDGMVNVNVGQVSGTLNIQAGESHVTADSKVLSLGHNCVSGDPTYYNTGDIAITDIVTASENVAILAQGNITATTPLAEILVSDGTRGFDVLLIAGAKLTYSTTGNTTSSLPPGAPIPSPQTVSVDLGAGPGGDIDLSSSLRTNVINASGLSGNGAGGNVTLVAVASGSTGGHVTLPSFSPIVTSGFGSGAGGKVTIFAGAQTGTAITAGNIVTGGGAASLNAALPTTFPGGPVVVDSHGNITSSNFLAGFSLRPGNIVLNGPINAGSGAVSVEGGGSISGASTLTGGSITLFGTGDFGSALTRIGTSSSIVQASSTTGNVFLEGRSSATTSVFGGAGAGQTFDFQSAAGTNGTIAILNFSGISAPGGTVNLSADGAGNIVNPVARVVTAGTVNLRSGTGSIGTSTARILTDANIVTANTGGGDVFLENSRSLILGVSSAGNGKSFDLQTKSGSNGSITVAGDVAATAGTLATIRLAGDGVGGVARTAGTLTATGITLSSDAAGAGAGSGNIGTSDPANNVFTQAKFITAQTKGNVFIQQSGTFGINASSAGDGMTFSITAAPGSRSSVNVLGNIAATTGTIGTITLRSDGPGLIAGAGTLTATGVNLSSDSGGVLGAGRGDISATVVSSPSLTPFLTVNTKGNAFVQSSGGSVSIGASSAGDGKLFDIELAPGSGGGITVNRDIQATEGIIGTLVLAADGAGNIKTGINTLTAANVGLSTGSGNINGNIAATNVTALTAGNVNLEALHSVTVGPSAAGGDFNLRTRAGSGGSITVSGDITGGTITLASDGAGGISRAAGTLTATQVNLSADSFGVIGAGTGNIGAAAAGTQVFTAAGTVKVNTNGSVFVRQTGNVVLDPSGSNAGDAQTFSLATSPASNGSININGNVTAGAIILTAGGSGSISASGGTLIADSIGLTSSTGNIGSSVVAPVETEANMAAASTVSANSGGNGNVFIHHTGLAILSQSMSGASFNFTATGGLSVSGTLTTANGAANLITNAGVLSVAPATRIAVNQGNLLIQNQDTAGGSIQIGAGAVVSTFSVTKSTGMIGIVIGAVPQTPAKGPKVTNVVVKVVKPGLVFLGANGITAAGPTNTLSAIKQNIVFNTGALPKSAIALAGGVTITADPVFPGGEAHRGLSSLPVQYEPVPNIGMAAAATSPDIPVLIPLPGLSGTVNAGDLIWCRTAINHTQQAETGSDAELRAETLAPHEDESRAPLELIAFRPSATCSWPASAGMQTVYLAGALIKHTAQAAICEKGPGCLIFTSGEALVAATRTIRIDCGDLSISVKSGAAVLISREDNVVTVRSLYDRCARSVYVLFHGQRLSLAAGAEAIYGLDTKSVRRVIENDRVGRRQVSGLVAEDGRTIVRSEVSLVSLMLRNALLCSLNITSGERHIKDRVTKMAACLAQVTGAHGAYAINTEVYNLAGLRNGHESGAIPWSPRL